MKLACTILATVASIAFAPTVASAATLIPEPVEACYREGDTITLLGSGFTPSAPIDISRDGEFLGQLISDPAGALGGELTFPGLLAGEELLTYTATDVSNPAIFATTALRVSATDVRLSPARGKADRLLRIRARGFEVGRVLYAHIERLRSGRVRNVEIDLVEGDCGTLSVRQRLFSRNSLGGRYRVQFDTFARYQRGRSAQSVFNVDIEGPAKRRPRRTPSPSPPPPRVNCQGYIPCLPPGPDVDCAGGSGNGPRYVKGPVSVNGSDPYGLDGDGDGVGCDS